MDSSATHERNLIKALLAVEREARRRSHGIRGDVRRLAQDEKVARLRFKRNTADRDAEQRWWDLRQQYDAAKTRLQDISDDARMAAIITKEIKTPPELAPSGTIYLLRPSATADRVKIGWTNQTLIARLNQYRQAWRVWLRDYPELPPFDATEFECVFPGLPADELRLCSMFRRERRPMPFKDVPANSAIDPKLAKEWFSGATDVQAVMRANRSARLTNLNHRLIWRLELDLQTQMSIVSD